MTDKFEGTLPMHLRVKVASVARLHQYFVSNDIDTRTMSGLLSSCIYLLEEILESNNKLRSPLTLDAAYQYLASIGLLQKSSVKAGIKNLSKNIMFKDVDHRFDKVEEQVDETNERRSFMDEIDEAFKIKKED